MMGTTARFTVAATTFKTYLNVNVEMKKRTDEVLGQYKSLMETRVNEAQERWSTDKDEAACEVGDKFSV